MSVCPGLLSARVCRAIYDGGNVDRFVSALQQKIRHYDRDIERLCSFHFNGFIEAVQEVLTLREQCRSLRVWSYALRVCNKCRMHRNR